MGTIAEKLQNIIEVKNALSGIIVDKGEEDPEKFSEYPSLLSGSGGSIDWFKPYQTGITDSFTTEISTSIAYLAYCFKTTGDVYFPNLTEINQTSMFREAQFGKLYLDSATEAHQNQLFQKLSADELHLEAMEKWTAGTNMFADGHIDKIWIGWKNISRKVPVLLDTSEYGSRFIRGSFHEVYLGYLSSTTATTKPIGTGLTEFSNASYPNPNLSAIYLACEDDAAHLTNGLGGFTWIMPESQAASNALSVFRYAVTEKKWYCLTTDGTYSTNILVPEQESMPEIPQ